MALLVLIVTKQAGLQMDTVMIVITPQNVILMVATAAR